eukprot:scaffold62428_cov21-Tisochrysis_lutea.AAC.1
MQPQQHPGPNQGFTAQELKQHVANALAALSHIPGYQGSFVNIKDDAEPRNASLHGCQGRGTFVHFSILSGPGMKQGQNLRATEFVSNSL